MPLTTGSAHFLFQEGWPFALLDQVPSPELCVMWECQNQGEAPCGES